MKRLAAAAFVAVLVTAAVQADVIYSNLGPGNSFNTSASWVVCGPGDGYGGAWTVAMPFTPSGSYALDSVTVAMGIYGGTNSFDLALYDDVGGYPGTTMIESWSGITMGPLFTTSALETVASVTNPLLASGDQYWLVASANGDTDAGWMYNSTGDNGPITGNNNGGAWIYNPMDIRGAFSVEGTPASPPVPEPCTLALFALGAVGLLGRRRKK